MLRLFIIAALGYTAYLAVRRMYRQVPDDFEPVALLAPPVKEPAGD